LYSLVLDGALLYCLGCLSFLSSWDSKQVPPYPAYNFAFWTLGNIVVRK
jgi:hypothetical protein